MEDGPSALAAHASKSHPQPPQTVHTIQEFSCLRIISFILKWWNLPSVRISRDFWMLLWGSRDFSKCKVSLGVSGRLRCLLPTHPSSALQYSCSDQTVVTITSTNQCSELNCFIALTPLTLAIDLFYLFCLPHKSYLCLSVEAHLTPHMFRLWTLWVKFGRNTSSETLSDILRKILSNILRLVSWGLAGSAEEADYLRLACTREGWAATGCYWLLHLNH